MTGSVTKDSPRQHVGGSVVSGDHGAPPRARVWVQARRRTLAFVASLSLVALGGAVLPAPAAHADSIRDGQYWLKDYGITKAWESSKGAGVKVAIIDSGIDAKHPDLQGAVVGGTDVSGAGNADGTKTLGAKPEHGTLVASLLAGRGHPAPAPTSTASPGKKATDEEKKAEEKRRSERADGMIGVAPEAQILSASTWLGSANPAGKTDVDQIPEAVRWAVDNGAKVINISLGSSSQDWPQSWDAAFLYAEQKDVVIVAAAGNRGAGNIQVGAPATIPGVVTVAGLDRKDKASQDSSSQGISIAVSAPAEELEGALPGGGYATWDGTSGAAPIVAGVAALIRSKYPELNAPSVINRIIKTARAAGQPGRDPLYGFGILDAERALNEDVPTVEENPLGTIAQWINVHRRGGQGGDNQPVPTAAATLPPSTLKAPGVPEASEVVRASSPLPATMVLGFSGLLLLMLIGGTLHVRRAGRSESARAAQSSHSPKHVPPAAASAPTAAASTPAVAASDSGQDAEPAAGKDSGSAPPAAEPGPGKHSESRNDPAQR